MNGYVPLAIVVAAMILVLAQYNSLIARKNAVANAFAGLDAMLQKRNDLVPNLVAVVQGYMAHERSLLAEVTRLRAQAAAAPTAAERHALDLQLQQGLSRVLMLSENYPELRASSQFSRLQAALNEIEEQISAARRAFNATVTDYNNAIQSYPGSALANAMGLRKLPWFEIEGSAQRAAPSARRLSS
jgi:LemA protein